MDGLLGWFQPEHKVKALDTWSSAYVTFVKEKESLQPSPSVGSLGAVRNGVQGGLSSSLQALAISVGGAGNLGGGSSSSSGYENGGLIIPPPMTPHGMAKDEKQLLSRGNVVKTDSPTSVRRLICRPSPAPPERYSPPKTSSARPCQIRLAL